MNIRRAVISGLAVGCQPVTVTTPAQPQSNPDQTKGVHIHTPGANVDVHRRDTAR